MAISGDEVRQQVASLAEIFRRQGLKVTHQRMEILKELVRAQEHPSAETVYVRVRRRIPAISLDTVYRTLKLLEEKGIISRVGSMRDRARFDANTDQHHHFICIECGRVGDFHSDVLDRFPVPPEVAEMGSVDGVYVELRGRCRKCQSRATKAKRPQEAAP